MKPEKKKCAVCGTLTDTSFRGIPVCEVPYRQHRLLVAKGKRKPIHGYRYIGQDDEVCVYVEEDFKCGI